MDDYYKILNIDLYATQEEIKNNYDKIINEYKILPYLTENDKKKIVKQIS